jgi:hypothetical protein
LTRRLFYGLHSTMLFNNGRSDLGSYSYTVDGSAKRAIFGAGLGYAIRPQTTIAFDVAGGVSREAIKGRDYLNEISPYRYRNSGRFITVHAGGQTDVGRHFFLNGSMFWTGDMTKTVVLGYTYGYEDSSYSNRAIMNVGPGWRITRDLSTQYIFSKSSLSNRNSHSIMMQYNFGSGDR